VSEPLDDLPGDPMPGLRDGRGPSLRARLLIIAVVVVVVGFFAVTTFASVYTDALWYHYLHFGGVFRTLVFTKTALFLVFGLVMALSVGGSMAIAFRTRPVIWPPAGNNNLYRYRDVVTPVRSWLLLGVAGLSGLLAGASGASKWRLYLLWRHGGSFGETDPYFHKDVGFYVFDLPWWHYLVSFVMTTSVVALVAGLLVHYLFGGVRVAGAGERFTRAAQAHLSLLLGIFVLAQAADYWLGRYDLVHNDGSLFTGMGFTGDHAVLPAKNILTGIALICALLFFVNVWRRTWQLPSVGLALFIMSALLLGLIWPAIVQGVQVKPSQADKERDYLAANILATRSAYGLENVKTVTSDTALNGTGTVQSLDDELSSAPLVDPDVVHDQFEQTQQGKAYYTVAPTLDVDHYKVDGKDRAVVIGVRELNQAGISTSDQNWTNLHTVYTHGNGVIAAYGNQRDAADEDESPDMQWAEGLTDDDLTQSESAGSKLPPEATQVYFGENSPDYSIVGRPSGSSAVELDSDGTSVSTTTYEGSGGVPIGSEFRRLMYAIKFGSTNFVLSERVNDDSKVLYDRSPRERVEKVAPWLTLDDDVYPVVTDDHVYWVLDGYTTTNEYPEAQRESFQRMTDDATQTNLGLQTLPTDQINYIRNSVKAVVDAYTGEVTLYEWDDDPILDAWEAAFPGTVQPRADIPADLLPHLRYPEDLYKVQRYQLARYHVTDATDFLQASDRWAVPEDPDNLGHLQTPVRTFLTPASESDDAAPVWSMTSTFVPYNRATALAAVMSVDSDPTSADYGQITVLEGLDDNEPGPAQVSNLFKTNAAITDAIAKFSRSSGAAIYGNIVTIPTSDSGLIYLEPVYATQASASSSSYAVLAYILVDYDGNLGYGRTLSAALTNALSSSSQTPPPDTGQNGGTNGSGGGKGTGTNDEVATLLDEAKQLFAQADAAGQAGNYARREQLLSQAQKKVDQAAALLAPSVPSSSSSPDPGVAPTFGVSPSP